MHFSPMVCRWGGPSQMLCVLFVMLALVGSALDPTAGSAKEADPDTPLDLAAMALTPSDLAAEGFEGYGSLSGKSHVGPWPLVAVIGDLTYAISDDELRQTMRDAGLLHGYQLSLRLQGNPDDRVSDAVRDVVVSFDEFADDGGAADAFELTAELAETSMLVEYVEGNETIGDGSVLFRQVEDHEDLPHKLLLVFRVDRLIVVVQIWDYAGEEPTVAEVERLGARLLERIDAGFAGETPGLSGRALRLKKDDFEELHQVRGDHYLRLDGEDLPLDYEDAERVAERTEIAGEAIDVYAFGQFIQEADAADPALPYQIGWGSTFYRFADDEAAADWLADRPERIEREAESDDITVRDLEVLEDAPVLGDESVTVSYLAEYSDGYVAQIFRVQARFGAIVIDLQLSSSAVFELPFAAFEALAARQSTCFTSDDCPSGLVLSEALTGPAVVDGAGSTTGRGSVLRQRAETDRVAWLARR